VIKHVLLVDSDSEVLTARGDELAADAFEPRLAPSAAAAQAKLADADAMVLGRLESTPVALGLLRDLRGGYLGDADPAVPVVTIGADRDHELVRHYQAGTDIALPSDASPLLVTASLHALAASGQRQQASSRVRVGNLSIGIDNGTAMVADRPLALTHREFQVLSALARDPAVVVSKQQLLSEVWQGYSHSRAPDTVVQRLRDRLQADGANVTVKTHHGRGWQLASAPRSELIAAAFPQPPSPAAPRQSATAASRPPRPQRSRSPQR